MARSTPAIYNTTLLFDETDQARSLVVGSGQWFSWLCEETSTSFAFHSPNGTFTARKERAGSRRGGWYWKAYRKYQGKQYRAYLGKSEELTLARLNTAALLLATRTYTPVASSPGGPDVKRQSDHQEALDFTAMPLLATRLHPPSLPGMLIERSRLFALLNTSFAHKLTLVQAPAGFGKTTLVNQWLVARSASSALPATSWVSLDAGDNDPLRFWRSVMMACLPLLATELRASGLAALALLSSTTHSPLTQPPLESALAQLLNALSALSSGGMLVLDDYHVITATRLHETLTFFLDHLPQTMRVLLISRTEPNLPLLRWRARGELGELHASELRFSSQETIAYLRQALPVLPSDAALARLDTSLEGWAAGLRLLCLTLSRWRTSAAIEQALLSLGEQVGLTSPERPLLDYLVSEVVETQPEAILHFLLHTSVLSRLCGPLCDAVIGGEESSAQLELVEQAGLFLEALEGPGGWYRYHALFAEALRREASHRLGEEALRELWRRASAWYEKEAFLNEAIEAAWLAQDVERVAWLIEQLDAQDFSEPQTMLRWLEQLPIDVLRAHPILCLRFACELHYPVELHFAQEGSRDTEGISRSETQWLRIDALLQMAEDSWRASGIQSWIGAIWAFRVVSGLGDQAPFSTLAHAARQALFYLPEEEGLDPRLQVWRGPCLVVVGREKLRLGQVDAARQLLCQVQANPLLAGNHHLTAALGSTLARVHLIQGELRAANSEYHQVYTQACEMGDDEIGADALLELAWLSFEWNDLAGAEQQAREALQVAQRLYPPRPELRDRAMLQLALITFAHGEAVLALEQLTTLLANPPREWTPASFWLLPRVRTWQGRLCIATGDVQGLTESSLVQSQWSEQTSFTEYLTEQMLLGRLWLAQGQTQAALRLLADLLPQAQARLHQYAVLEIEVLLALAYAAEKQGQQAHSWLQQALSQAVHEGYIRLFLNEGKPLLLLLRSLLPILSHDITLRAYAQKILRAATPRTGFSHTPLSPSDDLLFAPLSAQEQRVLLFLAAGWSNQQIAHELIVSVNTVKYHIKHLYQKLGVSNRIQASEIARHLKLDKAFPTSL